MLAQNAKVPHHFLRLFTPSRVDKADYPGARLAAAREAAGWSQTETASIVDVERSTYRSWENNPMRLKRTKRRMVKVVAHLCKEWGIEPKQIWGEEVSDVPDRVAETRAPYRTRKAAIDRPLAKLLLEILENPQSPEDQRKTAKATILEAFPEVAHS